LIYLLSMHLVFFGDDRFHLPFLPLVAIGSALALFELRIPRQLVSLLPRLRTAEYSSRPTVD